jgi:hypothetical protein
LNKNGFHEYEEERAQDVKKERARSSNEQKPTPTNKKVILSLRFFAFLLNCCFLFPFSSLFDTPSLDTILYQSSSPG